MAKRPVHQRVIITLLFLALTGMLAYVGYRFYRLYKRDRAEHISYKGFGIEIPTGYRIHGIDVSRYQGTIGWKAVKKMKVDSISPGFVFIKATEGVEMVDRNFKYNWRESGKAGMVRGAYHFFIPGLDAAAQANNYIKNTALVKGTLPPVVDVEASGDVPALALRAGLITYLGVIEKHYKVKPIIYTYLSFYEDYLGKEFDSYPLWIAHYLQPVQPRITRPWTFWQHSDMGRVNGIKSAVDFNVFNGDSVAFRKMLL